MLQSCLAAALLPHNPLRSQVYGISAEPAKVDGWQGCNWDVRPDCTHSVCNGTYFVRVAAVRTPGKKVKGCDLENSHSLHQPRIPAANHNPSGNQVIQVNDTLYTKAYS